mmetsp:Transcript_9666/g.8511  ORF Transcript_9666/g.8511 Transcript_9666/m.8511 type:complete len:133 (-) Transcript_9666:48-446(-)
MGNAQGGEDGDGEYNSKIDKTDPTTKRKKKIVKKGTGAQPVGSSSTGNFTENGESKVSEAVRNSEFLPDPELDQGFPEDKVEYETTPCLAGVEDEYTKNVKNKNRKKKKGKKNGVEEAFEGDADFGEPEVVE